MDNDYYTTIHVYSPRELYRIREKKYSLSNNGAFLGGNVG